MTEEQYLELAEGKKLSAESELDRLVEYYKSKVIGLELRRVVYPLENFRLVDWSAWSGYCGVYYFIYPRPTEKQRVVVYVGKGSGRNALGGRVKCQIGLGQTPILTPI
jgi:hypothetical protein